MPPPLEEVVGDDPGQDLVQAFGQRVAHGDTWMQRRTYVFVVVLQVGSTCRRCGPAAAQGPRVREVSGLGEGLEDGGPEAPAGRFVPLRHVGVTPRQPSR